MGICLILIFPLNKRTFCLFLAFVTSLLPVIFLNNQRNPLYLYIPLFYIVLSIFIFIKKSIDKFSPKQLPIMVLNFSFLIAIIVQFTPQKTNITNYILTYGKEYKTSMNVIQNDIKNTTQNTEIYFFNLPKYLNVFDYGHCNSLKIVYKNKSLSCFMYQDKKTLFNQYNTSPSTDKYFYEYFNGSIDKSSLNSI
jgi:hypothetical protein